MATMALASASHQQPRTAMTPYTQTAIVPNDDGDDVCLPEGAIQCLVRNNKTNQNKEGALYYLIPASYMETWLSWAYTLVHPKKTYQATIKRILTAHQLKLQSKPMLPGPVDANNMTIEKSVAVPSEFYECLRSIHGVVCEDNESISFQNWTEYQFVDILYYQTNDNNKSTRPCEFPRKVVRQPKPQRVQNNTATNDSSTTSCLMDKLLLDEEKNQFEMRVEVVPIRLEYLVNNNNSNADDGTDDDNTSNYCLVSRCSSVETILESVKQLALPQKTSSSVRVWRRSLDYPAHPTPGSPQPFELVEDVENRNMADWYNTTTRKQQQQRNHDSSLQVLLETMEQGVWPRQSIELGRRLQPGDWVDAQDVAGHWYEALVVKVKPQPNADDDDKPVVTVHFVGWAKRWDSVPTHIAPLWTYSTPWREQLAVNDEIEVRDASSVVQHPKWYRGIVKEVSDEIHDMDDGAQLEQYNDKDLLVLGQTKQIRVYVEEEDEQERWVNLYGEEICKLYTHLKEQRPPAILRYEVDGARKPVEVMKTHLGGSGFLRESLRGVPPATGTVGLHNLGNSCFLNSTVQCLNHIMPISEYFLEDKYSKDLNKRNPLGSGGNVAVSYAGLLKKMWAGKHSVLVPRLLKQTVANFAPQFDNSYQHDSHEFCQFLMDGLHEDLNRVKNKPYVEELEAFGMEDRKAAIESWKKHLLRHDSVIVDRCQGMHRSHLTCPQCGRESIKFDVYSSISLPIPTSKHLGKIDLADCIEKFMEAEQLDERDAYYCPNCRRHVCALKLIALWSVPDVLIFHLKRFTFDACMLSGGMLRSKVDHTVEFPIQGLDLTKQVLGPIDPEAPPVYNLVGVSEHLGPTANSGHYAATIRNSADGKWYRCNDSHVGQTSGEAALTGGAYLLFYQRAKGRSRWAGMEKSIEEMDRKKKKSRKPK